MVIVQTWFEGLARLRTGSGRRCKRPEAQQQEYGMHETTISLSDVRVLLLPGWLDSGPGHWQTRWQHLHGFERVEQSDWLWPRRGDWLARLDEVVLGDDRPVVLAAHSLGCHLVAAWSAWSRHTRRVRGALLVAPPDTERADTPPQLHGWRPMVLEPIKFAACAVVSSDDPFCEPARAAHLCAHWQVGVRSAGARGHLNAQSGLGDWLGGLELLKQLAIAHGTP
jgi:predicted alpha/beta hydrolase family esterase